MIVIAYWALIIALAGLALWGWIDAAKHPIAKEAAKWMYIVGLFWFVYPLVGKVLRFGG